MSAPDYRWLHQLADRHTHRMQAAITKTIDGLARQVTDDTVELDLRDPGDPVRTLSVLDAWQVTKDENNPVSLIAGIISPAAIETAPKIAESLKLTSPLVRQQAERLVGHMIRDVKENSRKAVRKIIADAWEDGIAPRDTAKLVKQVIGLDRRRAVALANFKRAQTASPNADAKVSRYATRLVKQRAVTIARTETLRAANAGVQLGWREMKTQGLLPASFKQQWITTPDDRLCELCAPMGGQTVLLEGDFVSSEKGVLPSERVPYGGGTFEQPPLHPSCRCTIGGAFD